MENLETCASEYTKTTLLNSNSQERESYLKLLADDYNTNNIYTRFNFKTPIQTILKKFCDNKIDEYIFHTRIYLEYDEEEAFVFVFKSSLVFTHVFEENENEQMANPIIYIIKFQQIYYYYLQVNETDSANHIILQFYENDFVKKSEM